MIFFLGIILWSVFVMCFITAPLWIPAVWGKVGFGSAAKREKSALNDAILDSLTAHFMERRDLWELDSAFARCYELDAKVCILSSIFDFSIGSMKGVDKVSSKAKKRFLAAVNGAVSKNDLAKAKQMLDKIEKSINERRENVVNMSARK